MKITMYALHLGFGGVENYVCTIASMLAKEHEVEIVSTYKTTSTPAFPIAESVKITYLLPNDRPNTEAFKVAVKKKQLFNILKEGLYACKILWLKTNRNKQSIKRNQSDVVISTRIFHNRLIKKYAKRDCVKITGEHNHPHGNEAYMKQVIKSCEGFDYFLPISNALCELYRGRLSKKTTILHIPFCIEKSGVSTHTFPKNIRLLNVGRLSAEKGIKDLIALMDDLVHKEKLSVCLDIIGSGELETDIKKDIQERNLEHVIVLHGFQNKEFIYKQYQEASLYVMTSFTESFGIVLLEAMSCGVPCIAYDSAEGSTEIIDDGINGYIIKGRDRAAMCAKIKAVSKNETLLQQLSKQAFIKADTYSYEACEAAWLSLFQTLKDKEMNT